MNPKLTKSLNKIKQTADEGHVIMLQNGNGDKQFMLKMSEWRGYMVRALEDIDKDLKTIFNLIRENTKANNKNIKEVEKANIEKIKKVEKSVTGLTKRIDTLYLKVAGVATMVGIIASLVFGVAKEAIVKLLGGG